jgi:catechol 2,3-dioxygenase-like lactoylglutathione lyase family enzyme
MSTQTRSDDATGRPRGGTVELKLEVVVLPVSDVDRAKRFYEGLGWRLDIDFNAGDDFRGVQFTPPGSPCSIHFGKGVTTATPGSVRNVYLVVSDIEAARAELIGRGVEVSEAYHHDGKWRRVPGRDPEGRSYNSFATFSDPDGNTWLLQEITARFPGRVDEPDMGTTTDVAALTELLRETEGRHGGYEATAPKHHWSGWYAAYMVARQQGQTPDESARDAAAHMERTRDRG